MFTEGMNNIRGGIPIQDHLRARRLANATSASVLPRRQIAKEMIEMVAQLVKSPPAMQGTQVRFLGLENRLEKE